MNSSFVSIFRFLGISSVDSFVFSVQIVITLIRIPGTLLSTNASGPLDYVLFSF